MKEENINKIQTHLVKNFEKQGDKPSLIFHMKSYTGNEVANEIKNETILGVEMVDNIVQLAVDLLIRKKKTL